MDKLVSAVIPVYNEEKYIDKCISSLLHQDYGKNDLEFIFVDGCSEDKTVEIINRYAEQFPELIRVINNPYKVAPHGVNIGIKNSSGKYIIRLDAHSEYYPDYISKCVYYLENTDADNVGGVAETISEGFMGNAIAGMLSTKFGVGNSEFRTNGESGYVDTVPFGAFKRKVFDKVGLFNTELLRSEDNEINARIRKNGGKIYLSSDIKFKYYCRNTVGGILSMGIKNGNALFRTVKVSPEAMSIRHFIPFIFFASLIVMPVLSALLSLFGWLFLAEMALYLALDLYFSFIKGKLKYGIVTVWLYPLFHICYGLGSMLGLFGIKLY